MPSPFGLGFRSPEVPRHSVAGGHRLCLQHVLVPDLAALAQHGLIYGQDLVREVAAQHNAATEAQEAHDHLTSRL